MCDHTPDLNHITFFPTQAPFENGYQATSDVAWTSKILPDINHPILSYTGPHAAPVLSVQHVRVWLHRVRDGWGGAQRAAHVCIHAGLLPALPAGSTGVCACDKAGSSIAAALGHPGATLEAVTWKA